MCPTATSWLVIAVLQSLAARKRYAKEKLMEAHARNVLRRRIGVGCVVLGAASLLGAWIPLGVASADTPTNGACNGAFTGTPPGSLAKATNPTAGSTVVAGQNIAVTVTWSITDWTDAMLNQIHDCVQINGTDIAALNAEEKPTNNDGSWTTSYAIPSDAVAGDTVCDRASLSGNPSPGNESTQKSNKVCFTVANATTTTTARATTTSSATTSTTAGATTTTSAGATTTTAAQGPTTTVSVLGVTVTNGPTTSTTATKVLGAQLARTGRNVKGLLLMAGLAFLLGGLAIVVATNREPQPID